MKDRVAIIGGGGREHAIAWKLKQSPMIEDLYVLPGNAGVAEFAQTHPLSEQVEDFIRFCQRESIDFVVVSPDNPLAEGWVDALEAASIPAFGPTQAAAELEWSKDFAKQLMTRIGVPTAAFQSFEDFEAAKDYLVQLKPPYVLKADGLALGKGVLILEDEKEALEALRDLLVDARFGSAGQKVLIEEFLTGPECSVFCFTDGEDYVLMPTARDHKRAFDGDLGPNTGGMGAVSPGADFSEQALNEIRSAIIEPVLAEMRRMGRPYHGVLYIGLMLTPNGPKVIEFNSRFGDPECQCLLPLLRSDLYPILRACREGGLKDLQIEWLNQASAAVVLASGGYPGSYRKGLIIDGLDQLKGDLVFHAGTALDSEGHVTAVGGRVLAVVAVQDTLDAALNKAYEAIARIQLENSFYRHDIGRSGPDSRKERA